jgi:hypothetical protein
MYITILNVLYFIVLNILVNILADDGGWSLEYVRINKKLY